MSITQSGVFLAPFVDVFDTTQLAFNFDADTLKAALFPSTITPDFSATAANAAYNAGVYSGTELTGTGYTAGGATLASITFTGATAIATFDAADTSWTTSTITGARGLLIYNNTLAGKNAFCLVDLGSSYSTSAGTLLVTYSASGIARFTLA